MPPAESTLSWFAGVMLPAGGHIVMFDVECAFDESGTHAGSPLVCVAGYIMQKVQARALEDEWNAVLAWDELPAPLPYFHMADCAPDPGNGVFAGLTKAQRIQVVARLIGVIKRNTAIGVAVTVRVSDYEEILAGHPFYPDPYVLAAHLAMSGVFKFIDANPRVGKVAYFFEAGHSHSHDANRMMRILFRIPRLEESYAGHAFVPKAGNPVVQAADLLAWQWLKDRKNQVEGRPRRKDLASLMVHPHNVAHINPDIMALLASNKESVSEILSNLSAMGLRV